MFITEKLISDVIEYVEILCYVVMGRFMGLYASVKSL